MLDHQFPLSIGATTRTVLLNGSTLAAWTWVISQRGSGIAPSACPCSRRRKCSRSKNEESPIMATMFFSLSFHKFAVEVFLACDYQPFLGNYHLNVDLFEVFPVPILQAMMNPMFTSNESHVYFRWICQTCIHTCANKILPLTINSLTIKRPFSFWRLP